MEKSIYRKGKRTKIYYCHPYSSWERGSNENNNMLVRYWLPKSSDFDSRAICNIHILKRIQNWMNDYPRKLFDSGTAKEEYIKKLNKIYIQYIC